MINGSGDISDNIWAVDDAASVGGINGQICDSSRIFVAGPRGFSASVSDNDGISGTKNTVD
jgi:hypothetical protein